jgi:hypothetical protein
LENNSVCETRNSISLTWIDQLPLENKIAHPVSEGRVAQCEGTVFTWQSTLDTSMFWSEA